MVSGRVLSGGLIPSEASGLIDPQPDECNTDLRSEKWLKIPKRATIGKAVSFTMFRPGGYSLES